MTFSEHHLLATHTYKSQDRMVVDVGAHQGSVSTLFLNKGWKAIAFEPEKDNRGKLLQNLAGYSDFTCIPKAVSERSGEKVPFYVSKEHYGIHSLKPWHETHQPAYEVGTVRLDDALTELGIEAVTLLKIDIEGADFPALKSFDFERFKPELVMVEFMDDRTVPNFGYTYHDMVSYMKEKGYSTFVSEWAQIKDYGREGVAGEPHQWLQCSSYPLNHEPAWGNLIFVPHADVQKFATTLERYLMHLRFQRNIAPIKSIVRKLPGALLFYRWLKKPGL